MQKKYFTPSLLGYLGLLPFIGSSILVWIPTYHQYAYQSIMIYAAVILTFIGGVHWGLAMQACESSPASHSQIRNQFIFSIIPSLIAWLAVLATQSYTLIILALCFASFWYVEKKIYRQVLESWYTRLRNHLTLVATLCIVIAWFSTQ